MSDLSYKADKLIKKYAFGSSLTGFIPIPLVDMLGLMGAQRVMLIQLSKLYGMSLSKNMAKIWLTTLMGGVASRAVSPIVGGMFKMIPGIGTLIGGASMAALGGAATYAVGKVFQQHFENGGTLENFDPEKAKETFEAKLEKGKSVQKNAED